MNSMRARRWRRFITPSLTIARVGQQMLRRPASFTWNFIKMAKPMVDVRKYNVDGRTGKVPTPCRPHLQQSLALYFVRSAFLAEALRNGPDGRSGDNSLTNAWVASTSNMCFLFSVHMRSDAFRDRKKNTSSGFRLATELIYWYLCKGKSYKRRDFLCKHAK